MSEVGGPEVGDWGGVRIGTAEREAALKALEVHLTAGRLDLDEYAERSAKVHGAQTAADLRPLFEDLPAPHVVPSASRERDVPGVNPVRSRDHSPNRGRAPLFGRFGETLVGLAPIIAIVLFFSLPGSLWWIFLLVPAAGVLVYGNRHEARRARCRRGD